MPMCQTYTSYRRKTNSYITRHVHMQVHVLQIVLMGRSFKCKGSTVNATPKNALKKGVVPHLSLGP